MNRENIGPPKFLAIWYFFSYGTHRPLNPHCAPMTLTTTAPTTLTTTKGVKRVERKYGRQQQRKGAREQARANETKEQREPLYAI